MSTTNLLFPTFDENAPKYFSCSFHIKRRAEFFYRYVSGVNLGVTIGYTRELWICSVNDIEMDFCLYWMQFFVTLEGFLVLLTRHGISKTKPLYIIPAIAYMIIVMAGNIFFIPYAIQAYSDTKLGNQTLSFIYLTVPLANYYSDAAPTVTLWIIGIKLCVFSLGLYLAFKCYKYICDKEKHEKDEEIIHLLRDAEPL